MQGQWLHAHSRDFHNVPLAHHKQRSIDQRKLNAMIFISKWSGLSAVQYNDKKNLNSILCIICSITTQLMPPRGIAESNASL